MLQLDYARFEPAIKRNPGSRFQGLQRFGLLDVNAGRFLHQRRKSGFSRAPCILQMKSGGHGDDQGIKPTGLDQRLNISIRWNSGSNRTTTRQIHIGDADFTVGGFMDMTAFFRSTNLGSGIGSCTPGRSLREGRDMRRSRSSVLEGYSLVRFTVIS